MKSYWRCLWLILFSVWIPVASAQKNLERPDLQLLSDNVFSLSEVMLHDVTNPPAAARFYAYAMLGAYEVMRMCNAQAPDIYSKFKEELRIDLAEPFPEHADPSFCSNYAILEIGSRMMPSGGLLDEKKKNLIKVYRKKFGLSEKDIRLQTTHVRRIADQVIAYAQGDNYNKLSVYPRYTPSTTEGSWYPTPPEYMGAIEPQWQTIRTFFLDSARQFTPAPPAPFSKNTGSAFYLMMKEVYETVNNLTPEQTEIANFWDCNPFAVTYSGHLAIGLKKISPGGHWMGITGIACQQKKVALDSAVFIHTLVALTLHDSFISCWAEKYESNRIRPETAINNWLDPSWRPVLQTPPFPEYTSGHSVASTAVAEILTHCLGDNFAFTDTSEIYFGLPERDFTSFNQAAHEAAVSRLYGGIHFRDACEVGEEQGRRVGKFILERVTGESGIN